MTWIDHCALISVIILAAILLPGCDITVHHSVYVVVDDTIVTVEASVPLPKLGLPE
jgi:hypothetical protein